MLEETKVLGWIEPTRGSKLRSLWKDPAVPKKLCFPTRLEPPKMMLMWITHLFLPTPMASSLGRALKARSLGWPGPQNGEPRPSFWRFGLG